jgi:hypothetical protein
MLQALSLNIMYVHNTDLNQDLAHSQNLNTTKNHLTVAEDNSKFGGRTKSHSQKHQTYKLLLFPTEAQRRRGNL